MTGSSPKSEEARRYSSLIRLIMDKIELELQTDLDRERLEHSAFDGLVGALEHHKTRQGTTLRNNVWYGILDSVLTQLGQQSWESTKQVATLLFWQSTSRIMACYGNSAESAIRRDTGAVLTEVESLLRLIFLVACLSCYTASKKGDPSHGEPLIRSESVQSVEAMIGALEDSEKSFLMKCYSNESEDPGGDSLAKKNANTRRHLKILSTLIHTLDGRNGNVR